MSCNIFNYLFVTSQWCWWWTTQYITGSSLHFTMNDLIRHQQVVTEAERGKRGAFDFLTAAEKRSGGCTSCRQWLFIPPTGLHTNTHSLTKHRHIHTCVDISTQTDTHTNFLVFPLPSRTTTGSLKECVATMCVFVYELLSSSKQNYHHLFWNVHNSGLNADDETLSEFAGTV